MDTKSQSSHLPVSILRNMSDAVIATDKRGMITFTNPQADSLTGWNHDDALGQPVRTVIKLLDSEKMTTVKIPAPSFFQHNHKPLDLSHYILVSNDEKQTLIDAKLTPIIGYRGSITGSVLTFRDISMRILKAQQNISTEKVKVIGRVAACISQDMSNWIGAISSHASAIVDNLIPKTRAYEEAIQILETSEHVNGMLKRLDSLARADDHENGARMEQVNMSDVIETAVRLLKKDFAEKQILFSLRDLDNMSFVMANETQMLDCVVNLFLNAAEAMPGGGVITVDITEKSDAHVRYTVLRIRDTGCGMPRHVLDRIFEPCFTTKESPSALGLGLTVVESSLHRWKGYVKVRSQPGHGTSFRLFMRKTKGKASRRKKRSIPTGGETILLVDDKKELLIKTRDTLQEAGYKVHTAVDGEKGISLFRRHANAINLSIIDVVMPGKDGKTMLRNMLDVDPTALVIMISGFSREYVKNYLEHSVWDYIQKPLDHSLLLSSVRRALDQKALPDQFAGSAQ